MWRNFWLTGRLIHDAYDKSPRAGGKYINQFKLTACPYREQLKDMPVEDLIAEGGMCSTLEEYYAFIGKTPEDFMTVIRFRNCMYPGGDNG